jgi:hypothetical protein
LILDIRGVIVTFVYDSTTWQVYTSAGPQGFQGLQGLSNQGVQGVQGGAATSSRGLAIFALISA